jgi:Rrf2 family protein
MISRTGEYALRAMVYLTRHFNDWPIAGRKIAEETRIPPKYLSTILGQLVRSGILESTPGAGGGFRMARKPGEIMLFELLAPFEPMFVSRRPCPFGNEECSDDDPCAGHDEWKQVRETYSRFLERTSILDVTFRRDPHVAESPERTQ